MFRRPQLALLATSFALAVPVGAQAAPPYQHVPAAVAEGTGGAAATVDGVATAAALDVLERGGNAVDATVAAAAVLGVTEPFSAGIGGGGFMVIRTAKGRVTTIDSREESPRAMRPDSFAAAPNFDGARYSGLSAGVPGTAAGWERALERYGTWGLRRTLAPAIDVARRGFVVDQTLVDQATPNLPWFDDLPATNGLYGDLDVGETLQNPDLARTYERVARLGAERGFYSGPIAEAVVAASTDPPTGPGADKTWLPGLLTERDLERYRALRRDPTKVGYRGYDVYSMAPPSSGGSTVGEALNILEQVQGYPAMREVEQQHYMLEASRYAFADRNACVADPEFYDVPLGTLLDDAFAAQRRALITQQAANAVVSAGLTCPDAPGASQPAQSTTHLTVADRKGTVVSYTFTIESTGGNGIVVPGWGFLLNNELTDFNYTSTTHPNRADGRKRPRSSMAPTYVERNGRPFLALGSPGGATIITTVLQLLTERIDAGHTLPRAIRSPRASQRNTATTPAEAGFDTTALAAAPFGHAFAANAEIGAATGIEFFPGGGMQAVAEPVRRGGGAAGVVDPE